MKALSYTAILLAAAVSLAACNGMPEGMARLNDCKEALADTTKEPNAVGAPLWGRTGWFLPGRSDKLVRPGYVVNDTGDGQHGNGMFCYGPKTAAN